MKFSQLEFLWPKARSSPASGALPPDNEGQQVVYRRNPLARRYRLFVDREGRPRVTIPRCGSRREAEAFAARHRDWILQQVQRHAVRRASVRPWRPGTPILFRGQLTPIETHPEGSAAARCLRLGSEVIPLPSGAGNDSFDLRPVIEAHLRALAALELPQRTLALAAGQKSPVRKITIRSQRTRWGSCSRRGTISLNWRLVQVPAEVRDYIILHELMHLKEMNHSRRFWTLVAKACPDFKSSEAWLRAHSASLL